MVLKAYVGGLALQGDFARGHARELSAAASLGLITVVADGHFTNRWRPTVKGLRFIQEDEL